MKKNKSQLTTKAAFLDRDNVINRDEKGYLYKIKDFKWLAGVRKGIKILKDKGYLVIVISNQSGIGRGYYSVKDLKKLNKFINKELSKNKTKIDDFFHCPHHPDYGLGKYKKKCNCRKPKNGMIIKAEKKWKISLKKSFMIGDKFSDKITAKKSNIKFFYKKKIRFNLQIKKILKKIKTF